MYVDDCVIISRSEGDANKIMKEIKDQDLKLMHEGTIKNYLGIQINRHDDRVLILSQPFLVDRIIGSIQGMNDANPCKTPTSTTVILSKDLEEGG